MATQTAMIVIPEEAELLLPIVAKLDNKSDLITYAASVTRKMLHFTDMKYYSVPSLPGDWEASLWLKAELVIFAGSFYFEYSEYDTLLRYLGPGSDPGPPQILPNRTALNVSATNGVKKKVPGLPKTFVNNPLSFLQD